MSFAEILDAARALPKEARLQLVHALIDEIGNAPTAAQQEAAALASLLPPGAAFEVATPLDCYEAAAVLEQMLNADKGRG